MLLEFDLFFARPHVIVGATFDPLSRLCSAMQVRALLVVLVVAALLLLAGPAAATFRKPPFNGSIFGKRGSPDQARSMAGEGDNKASSA